MNNVFYYSEQGKCPFTVQDKAIYINFMYDEGLYYDTVDIWKQANRITFAEGIEMRVVDHNRVEFYKETITLSGVMMNNETGELTITMDNLETMLAQIPAKQIRFVNLSIEQLEDEK